MQQPPPASLDTTSRRIPPTRSGGAPHRSLRVSISLALSRPSRIQTLFFVGDRGSNALHVRHPVSLHVSCPWRDAAPCALEAATNPRALASVRYRGPTGGDAW